VPVSTPSASRIGRTLNDCKKPRAAISAARSAIAASSPMILRTLSWWISSLSRGMVWGAVSAILGLDFCADIGTCSSAQVLGRPEDSLFRPFPSPMPPSPLTLLARRNGVGRVGGTSIFSLLVRGQRILLRCCLILPCRQNSEGRRSDGESATFERDKILLPSERRIF
jgi:hypothetical protein